MLYPSGSNHGVIMVTQEPVWSVSAVNKAVKDTLEGAFMPFWMGGEVGSLLSTVPATSTFR